MKVAHLCVVTPRRCGLYETAREVVASLRKEDVDSRIVDIPTSNKVYPEGYPEAEDRGALMADMKWAIKADIIVNHSGYNGTPLDKTNQPIVHVAHGRPRSSFLGEKNGGTPIYSYHYKQNEDPRWKSIITFWDEHIEYLKVMFPDKPIELIQAPVDLEAWTPGISKYNFNGHKGKINVVCTDAWRDDVDPFIPLNAYALWARKHPGSRLHLYAKPKDLRGYSAIIKRIQDDGNMGELLGWVQSGLPSIYRAADFMLTANTIDTRSVREAMACGCPVVRVGAKLNGYMSDFDNALAFEGAREIAEKQFNPEVTARQFKRVLECI